MRVCESCGRENPDDRDFCECGEYLRWDPTGYVKAVPAVPAPTGPTPTPAPGAPTAPTPAVPAAAAPPPPPPAAPEPQPEPDRPLAAITLRHAEPDAERQDPLAVGVDPGDRARVLALVRNQSGIVDNYTLTVHGLPTGWWSVHPSTIHLTPFGSPGNYEQEVEIHLHPPRDPAAEARMWDLKIVATSGAHGRPAASARLLLGIQPYDQNETRIKPERASGRRKARFNVSVRNTSNAPLDAAFDAADTDGACRFKFDPPQASVPPGGTTQTRLEARPPRKIWIGRPQEHRLQVTTLTGDAARARGAVGGGGGPASLSDPRMPAVGKPQVIGPQVGPANVQIGPGGVQVGKPSFSGPNVIPPSVPQAPPLTLDPSRLRMPGRRQQAPAAPLLPTQAIFRQKAFLPWWLAIVVPLLALLALLLFLLAPSNVKVPEVVGARSTFEAERTLRDAGLRLDPQTQQKITDRARPGTVIGQTPAAGSKAEKGSDVTLLVAVGSGKVDVPKVVGMTPGDAEKALRAVKLTLGQASPQPLDPQGKIASQIPAADERVKAGTPVDIFMAKKKAGGGGGAAGGAGGGGAGKDIVVPATGKLALAAYAQSVSKGGLVPAPTRVFSDQKRGTLVGVDPPPGTKLKAGARVHLLVSAGLPRLVLDNDKDVLLINGADGTRLPAIAKTGAQEKDPSFAPDGRRVAYTAKGRIALGKVGAEGPPELLTDEGTAYADLSWAPSADNDVLAMSIVKADGDRDLCVGQIVDGALQPQCIAESGFSIGQPRWSPDGSTLLVPASRGDGSFGIVRYTSAAPFSTRAADWGKGAFVTPLAKGRGVLEMAVSPDGKSLAAAANLDTNEPRLYITKASNVALRDVKPLPLRACKLAWRADSRELVIVDLGAQCNDSVGQLSRVDVANPTRAVALNAAGDNPSYQPRKLPG